MAQPLLVPLPTNHELSGGYIVRVSAINPTTGDVVPGVNVSNVSLQVEQLAGSPGDLQTGPFVLVPGPGA